MRLRSAEAPSDCRRLALLRNSCGGVGIGDNDRAASFLLLAEVVPSKASSKVIAEHRLTPEFTARMVRGTRNGEIMDVGDARGGMSLNFSKSGCETEFVRTNEKGVFTFY